MIDPNLAHSPLGASAAPRYLKCPGSVRLAQKLGRRMVSTETDYARHGLAMHHLSAICLSNYVEAWEGLDRRHEYGDVDLDAEEVAAVQQFVDHCRKRREALKEKYGNVHAYVELPIYRPELHELYYGQLDYALHAGDYAEIWDFKAGAGIFVEAVDNAQIRMYGAGFVVGDLAEIRNLRLGIFQPRGFNGGARWEDLPIDVLMKWLDTVLLPGMERTQNNDELVPGEHCRFCPAKRGCPALKQQLEIIEAKIPTHVEDEGDLALGYLYQMLPSVKMKIAAIEAEVLRRNLANPSQPVPGSKIVMKKANRLWKEGARNVFTARFGSDALEPSTLKSPKQMEEISGAKDLVKAWAWTPDNGYTTAPLSDKRRAVSLASPSTAYPALDNMPEE